jgi:hypothetical protein
VQTSAQTFVQAFAQAFRSVFERGGGEYEKLHGRPWAKKLPIQPLEEGERGNN